MLRRLVGLVRSTHDLSGWNLYEKMDSLLTFRRHQGSLPTEVSGGARAQCCGRGSGRLGVPARCSRLTARTPQVVHCALQCTYYALLWQIVAATDRLPSQVGAGVDRVGTVLCSRGRGRGVGAGTGPVVSRPGLAGLRGCDVSARLGPRPERPVHPPHEARVSVGGDLGPWC